MTKSAQRVPSFADGFVSEEVKEKLRHLVHAHVESFNYFVTSGINEAICDIPSFEFKLENNFHVKMHFTEASIGYPTKNDNYSNNKLTPREARERDMSYAATLIASCKIELPDGTDFTIVFKCGDIPIMVMSEKCHLHGLNSKELVYMKEEANECGGYFIVNGIERVIRLLQVPRRNHPMAIERNSYKKRGPAYSDKGVTMRCTRKDQTSITLTLHFLTNGGATLRFTLRKQEFLLPLIIVAKSLVNISDKELFDRIVQGNDTNTFLTTRLELLLLDSKQYNISTQSECTAYLGSHFRQFLPITDRVSDEQAGILLIQRYLFIHTSNMYAKLDCLIHMTRKLFSFAQGECAADNPDALTNHEILLPGHLICMYVKEKLEDIFLNIKQAVLREYRLNATKCIQEIQSMKFYQKQFDRFGSSIGGKIQSFLSTGNITSSTGLDLMQVSGYTIVAERLNIFRYMSHFQSVHRGQFFTTMKTTLVRKLLPESWGFLCPVHTPDGSPCGLLNHMTRQAIILTHSTKEKLPILYNAYSLLGQSTQLDTIRKRMKDMKRSDWIDGSILKKKLISLGVIPAGCSASDGKLLLSGAEFIPVLLDGVVLGGVKANQAADIVKQLRYLKISYQHESNLCIDPTMEIAYIPQSNTKSGSYNGIYLFTEPGRMIRPVYNIEYKSIEWIGPMEQIYMEIACSPKDIHPSTTHIELTPSIMLSQIASFTPFSDYNQSPRNMYQCQMGKQTMGTPTHIFKHRSDNKLFRIQNTQAPLVQTKAHSDYCMDEYPQGVNAVVAVISFTGYDMEDAMIINKASYERGFGHGSVYKTHTYDLDDEEKHNTKDGIRPELRFSNIKEIVPPDENELTETDIDMTGGGGGGGGGGGYGQKVILHYDYLDSDGLPFEGQLIEYGQTIVCIVDQLTGQTTDIRHKDAESAYVDTVRVLGTASGSGENNNKKGHARKVSITLRYRRNPIIGDKFSSRHGQKGTLSVLWPQENMPFTESGMSPDVLINPHAFPSRMTIGMLIESMAGKAGAMHGFYQDATPFQYHEEHRVIDHVGEQLRACGYSYYGSEPLYNGLTGNIMHADIFIGVVFYQRLRHMVSDKAQVRSTGPVVALTRQPVKGRKKHGGIRLGEMERDSLLSHGVAFCLQDRLMNCSDSHLAHVCATCGSLLTVYPKFHPALRNLSSAARLSRSQYCIKCKSGSGVKPVHLPYVYRFLTNELAAMGIKLKLTLSEF